MAETRSRDDISEETRRALSFDNFVKPLDVENVRGLDRPMAAGPRDVFVGKDELGNRIYRTVLGTTYTVRPATAQESETTRTKVENWADAGMPLPSVEDVVDTAKAIPGAILDSAEGSLEGTATLGEAMSFAPAMGAASLPFEVPQGATRIFGGREARHQPIPKVNYSAVPDLDTYSPEAREAVYKLPNDAYWADFRDYFFDKAPETPDNPYGAMEYADAMAKEAMDLKNEATRIARERAGWSMGADGQPRFEIDDSKAAYLGQYFQDGEPVRLEEVLLHPDLYYQYPQLADVEVTLKPMEGLLGQWNPNTKSIELNSNRPTDEIKSTLLHEIQHAVQQIEGFDGGSNFIHAMNYGPIYEANSIEAKEAWQEYRAKLNDFENYEFIAALAELGKRSSQALQEYMDQGSGRSDSFFVQLLNEESQRFLNKDFYPNESYLLLARISDVIDQHPEFKDHLKRHLPEEQFEKIIRFDSSGTEFSPFNKNYGYQVLGLTPPQEPIFLELFGDTGKNAYKLYRRNMGETEARNVQTRQNMSMAERLANPPRSTEDIPRGFQWDSPYRATPFDTTMKFAEGGLVEDQTQFAFMADGGMVDDGVSVEPTTGNEVPPGSLKEEVADTIDAKISVGEYIVPADVVQYFGVAHFEKLRQKAKEGLAKMETDGRIGGDPEEDELPFSDDELEEDDVEEDGAQGFAEGGLAWNSPQMTGLTNTGVETATYVGPDGTKLPVLFMNGQPIQQIPPGYVPEGQSKAQQAAFKSVRPTANNSEADALNTMSQPKPMTEWGVEDFERYANPQGVGALVAKIPELLGQGGGLIGTVVNQAYQAQGAKALEEIENRLTTADLDAQSKTRLEAVRDTLAAKQEAQGNSEGIMGGIMGGLGELFDGGVRTTSEMPRTAPTAAPTRQPARTATPPSSSSQQAPTASPRPAPRPAPQSTPAPKNTTAAQKTSYASSGRNNSQQVSGDPRTGGFAEGGFVKRRNKAT